MASQEVLNWLEKLKKANDEMEVERNKPVIVKPKRQKKEEVVTISTEEGFVYILKSSNGYYKIGKAINVHDRVMSWQHEFPIRIKLLYSFACHERSQVENFLHNKYAKKRKQREWYALNKEDIEWLLNVKDYELG